MGSLSLICINRSDDNGFEVVAKNMSQKAHPIKDVGGVDIKKLRNKKLTSTEFMQVLATEAITPYSGMS